MSEARTSRSRDAGADPVLIHAPTVTVILLRQAASIIEAASEQLPNETIFFPPKEDPDRQPIHLEGAIALSDLGELISYLADMLEP